MSVVGALFTLGCGEYGTAPPPSLEEIPSLLSAATTPDIIVTTTSDAADFGGAQQVGDLPGPDGEVSLREAITAANNRTGPQVIGFNIPTSDPGFAGGVFTIRPTSGLPTLGDGGTTIDGATQTAFSGNSNQGGPEIVINGALLTGPASGLNIQSANNRIHSLVVNGIPGPCCESGIDIVGAGATGNVVTGCFIGLAPNGTSVLPNFNNGISIHQGASHNVIGGTTPQERNVISGNGGGIAITGQYNVVQGNFIGTDVTGTQGLGNGGGVGFFGGAANNTVGGSSSAARNIISANNPGSGVFIGSEGGASATTVQGNFIGTDVTGRRALGNGEDGIRIAADPGLADNNRIIGNILSANGVHGIGVFASSNNVIQGNRIGTDVAGRPVLGNAEMGVSLDDGGTGTAPDGNRIGGTDALHGNIIAGNGAVGINFFEAENTLVARNIIFSNAFTGVRVRGARNAVRRNAILLNGALGIDLGPAGVTPNDAGDGDVGANNLQNFPVLTSAVIQGGQLKVAGAIDTPNPAMVTIEFFANPVPTPGGDPSGHGEGAIFLGTASPNGLGSFNTQLPRVPRGTLVSATATDAAGNTSEFASNIAVQ
jgi:titin